MIAPGENTGEALVDLHLHSTHSDGSFTPSEVVEHASAAGLSAIALTDHDTVSGVPEAISAGEAAGIEVIAGTELSAQLRGRDVHILGYFLALEDDQLLTSLDRYQEGRRDRASKMVKKLNGLGVRVTFEQVMAKADGAAIGRPHVADVLVEEGFCFSTNQAFQKYLGYGRPAYEPKLAMSPAEAVNVIHDAGGIAVLAHPVLYNNDKMLPEIVAAGIDGIEVWHIKQAGETAQRYADFADANNLLKSGGSDCHGDARGDAVIGRVEVTKSVLENLRNARQEREQARVQT